MKLSKMRRKARSAFKHPRRILFRDDAGVIDARPGVGDEVVVPVVVVRGRVFTRPQAARQ